MVERGRVEVDLSAIRHNASEIKRQIGRAKLLAAVKGDGYGHGLVPSAKAALEGGADFLGVATLEEAARLREAGIDAPVLMLSTILPEEAQEAIRLDVRVTVCSIPTLMALNEAAGRLGTKARVHLKVDTGMGRLGVMPERAVEYVKMAKSLKNIEVEGISTHFPSADEEDRSFTERQIGAFKGVLSSLEAEGIRPPMAHASNSAATVAFPEARFDMVRCGLLIYGIWPIPGKEKRWDLKPAMRVVSRLLLVKEIPPGWPVSYGRRFVAERPTKVGVVPVGYHDGIDSRLSGKGWVIVKGKRVPIIGRVCMDHFMVDLTGVEGIGEGEEVVILGGSGGEAVTAEEIAGWLGSVPQEFTSRVGGRMRRVYIGGKE